MDSGYRIKRFKALYFKRRPIETKYDQEKKKMEVENFSGITLANIAGEFYEEAQKGVEEEQRGKGNKWKYQVNVNYETGVLT